MLSLEAESMQIPFFPTSRCFFQFSYHTLPADPTNATVSMAVLQIGLLKWSSLKTILAWIVLSFFVTEAKVFWIEVFCEQWLDLYAFHVKVCMCLNDFSG